MANPEILQRTSGYWYAHTFCEPKVGNDLRSTSWIRSVCAHITFGAGPAVRPYVPDTSHSLVSLEYVSAGAPVPARVYVGADTRSLGNVNVCTD